MKKFFKNIIKKKGEKISAISENKNELNSDEFNLYEYLLEKGRIIYTPENFNIEQFTNIIKQYMKEDLSLKTETSLTENNIYKIDYSKAGGIMKTLGVSGKFTMFLVQFEEVLIYDIKDRNWIENPLEKQPTIDISSWFQDSFEKEIINFSQNYILNEVLSVAEHYRINFDNRYIENMPVNQQIWFHTVQEDDEIMLAKLNIHSIKEYHKPGVIEKQLDLIFILTTHNILIAGFSQKGELVLFEDKTDEEIDVKRNIIKNEVAVGSLKLQPERNSSKLFSEIENSFYVYKNERIRKIAGLNYRRGANKFSENTLKYLIENDNNPYDEFCLFYTKIKENTGDFKEGNDKIIELLSKIIDDKKSKENLKSISETWGFSYTDKTIFLDLLTKIAETENQKISILSFYDEVREEFLKKNKDLINKTLFEINYSRFLIDCRENEKAVKLLSKLLTKLPDESVSDLLPPKKLDITGKSSGQLLKIKILDLLYEAEDKKDSAQYLLQTAELQPLNKTRLDALKKSSNKEYSNSAKIIEELLEPGSISVIEKTTGDNVYNPLDEKKIENILRHPATGKKGAFHSIQKWLSKVKKEDYSAIKSFSEKLSPEEHSGIYKEIKNIKTAFNIEKIEIFFARGEKSIGITGYEGDPPFIIIGYDHIKDNSKYKMTIPELKFLLGTEFAHIYFQHSAITSNDVWRGVADKGYLLLDTLFSVVPVVGIIGKSVSSVSKLNGLSKLLMKADRISAGSDLLINAINLNSFYKKITKSNSGNENKQKLLAASRLMQYTADRAGLLVTGDLKSAVRAILLSGENNYKYYEEINKTGLYTFLTEQNNDKTYKHQDFALRLANLFSFSLSKDFKELRQDLLTE